MLSFVPGGAAVLAMFILATLAKSKIGSKKTGKFVYFDYDQIDCISLMIERNYQVQSFVFTHAR